MEADITDPYETLKKYYELLNKQPKVCSNDECTPIDCIDEMVSKIPDSLWKQKELKILDPCCGNGNFSMVLYYTLLSFKNTRDILENCFYFNDINTDRLRNVETIFCGDSYNLNIKNCDYLDCDYNQKFDLILSNPPYAKILPNGKRSAKNHNLIKDFIKKSLSLLKPDGYLLFITPDNWMSYADRNDIVTILTQLQIIHLDIHSAKSYFKKIGSSFTWYIVQNCKAYKPIHISGIWKKKKYTCLVPSKPRKYIPLVYNKIVESILSKTIDNTLPKFEVKTSSDLHRYTKRNLINPIENEVYTFKLIHTPKQTVWASRAHKYQQGYKVFISTTDTYCTFIDSCGMTQSIAFIMCETLEKANNIKEILDHELYVFLNNICRWGNFNNIRILQHFPVPPGVHDIYGFFKINQEEQEFIKLNL
jgi:SAM-dependent methyltransferase